MIKVEVGDLLVRTIKTRVLYIKRIEYDEKKKKYKDSMVTFWDSYRKTTRTESLQWIQEEIQTGGYDVIKRHSKQN